MGSAERQTRRLFVAVPLPESVVPVAIQAQEVLQHCPGIRLLDPGQLHFTLAFIGEAGACATEAARGVVESVPAESGGEAWARGFMFMPSSRRARVVALGVADEWGVFARLFDIVMGGLEMAGVTQRERRPFCPHVTVARMRRPGPLQPTYDCGQARFGVESVCLYQSELRREGARYTVLARSDLQRAHGLETA
jgi:2'-5' RNA ligase